MLFELLATLSAGIFAGAAVYISVVEHPARLECGAELAVQHFVPSYRRATLMQAPLAIMGFSSAVAASIGGSVIWVFGAFLIGGVVPLTLIVIWPTTEQLLDPSLDKRSERATQLLRDWGRLHALRSLMGMAAFVIFVVLLAD
jgi:hypothetical protein